MNRTFEKFNLAGRTAIVTGGAGLLGAEFCRTLAEAGASVIVADLDDKAADRVVSTLLGDGLKAASRKVDVTQEESTRALAESTVERFGRLDILVNSAALDPKFDPQHASRSANAFEEYPLDVWEQALSVNLTGMFLCCQAAARPMLAQGRGVIINICSTYGLVGPDQRIYQRQGEAPRFKPVYYTVTKAGVLGLTRYLATYFAGKNIRVNALTPGGVFNDHDETFVKNYAAAHRTRPHGRPR